jgi:DNA-binding protein H-NS
MAQSYTQIQKQIETLQRQADELRQKEVGGVIARIKEAISHYGLTADQLGLGKVATGPRTAGKRAGRVSSAKYSDGAGNVWSGRGPRPIWLREAIAAGKTLQEFATGTGSSRAKAPKTAKTTKVRAPKKRRTGKLYRDEAGNTWSGFGRKPRWLKDALASGKTIEQLTA